MSEEIAISVKNVSKNFKLPHEKADSVKSLFVNPFNKNRRKYETQHALRDISFDIPKGEFFGIVGRNGSGKSTLLKIIAGIYEPNKGSVTVNGRLVPFIELGVGFNPELTGRENVYLNGALMGFSEKDIDKKYKAIVDFSELERFMDQKLKNYSSGMQVRLAFSVATILANSEVLLIDEVLAVGDADFQRKCFEYFQKLKRDKKTVIFVSHDMNAIKEYCDRAVLIDKSEVIFAGSADEAAEEYTRLFLPDIYKEQQKDANDRYAESQKDKNKGKWGFGGVDMSAVKTDKGVYAKSDKQIEVSYTVLPEHDFTDEIIPGITIKNQKGEAVCGTNSKVIKHSRISPNGKKQTFTWVLPNIFNQGEYTVEPAVLSAASQKTLQWWNDAAVFRVINDESTPHQVSPKISLLVK